MPSYLTRHLKNMARVFGAITLFALGACGQNTSEVNVYSARKDALIKPLLDQFSEETGIKVNLVTGKDDTLFARLKAEGRNSPADVLITTDAGRLYRAKDSDLLQHFQSTLLEQRVPEKNRDPEGYWYGLSLRSRVFVYAPGRVSVEEMSSYRNLAKESWKNRICIRSSGNIYNQSLVASIIAHEGLEKTELWLKGLVSNFARPPQGGDRDQIKAVAAGECDLAVVNTYYFGAMLNSSDQPERAAAEAVRLFWPNQQNRGAHMNVSGAGIAKNAPHRDSAVALIEFLTESESQAWYAEVNHEYPVVKGIKISQTLAQWGDFKADELDAESLGKLNKEAVKAMDRAAWK